MLLFLNVSFGKWYLRTIISKKNYLTIFIDLCIDFIDLLSNSLITCIQPTSLLGFHFFGSILFQIRKKQ